MKPRAMSPGPWKLSLPDSTLVLDAEGNQVATTFQGQEDYDENYERREADAEAIAALTNAPGALSHFRAGAEWLKRQVFALHEEHREGCRRNCAPGRPGTQRSPRGGCQPGSHVAFHAVWCWCQFA